LFLLYSCRPCMCLFVSDCRKRIPRAKFDINACSVKSIDSIYYSKLHCFKVTFKPTESVSAPAPGAPVTDKKITAVFAAEDQEALHYWLISFADCEAHWQARAERRAATAAAGLPLSPEPAAPAAPGPAPALSAAAAAVAASLAAKRLDGNAPPPGISAADLAGELRKRSFSITSASGDTAAAATANNNSNSSYPGGIGADGRSISISAGGDDSFYGSIVSNGGDNPNDSGRVYRVDTSNFDDILSHRSSSMKEPAGAAAAAAASGATSGVAGGIAAGVAASGVATGAGTAAVANAALPPVPMGVPVGPPVVVETPQEIAAKKLVSQLKFSLKGVRYPAERLARRVKIWYCSSGFSLSSVGEVEQFVSHLRKSGDAVLSAFSGEKFGDLQDWANLLAVLRKYEQKRLVDAPGEAAKRPTGITFQACVNNPVAAATTTTAAAAASSASAEVEEVAAAGSSPSKASKKGKEKEPDINFQLSSFETDGLASMVSLDLITFPAIFSPLFTLTLYHFHIISAGEGAGHIGVRVGRRAAAPAPGQGKGDRARNRSAQRRPHLR
jgi:hypothetical protein